MEQNKSTDMAIGGGGGPPTCPEVMQVGPTYADSGWVSTGVEPMGFRDPAQSLLKGDMTKGLPTGPPGIAQV